MEEATRTMYTLQGGISYRGETKDGMRHGLGTSFRDGRVEYRGEWREGRQTGVGTLFARDGSVVYRGGFLDGKKDGQGELFDEHGALRYAGAWKKDRRCGLGKGRSFHTTGETVHYEGEWWNDSREGFGLEYTTGAYEGRVRTYEGQWHADRREGRGRVYADDLLNSLHVEGLFEGGQLLQGKEYVLGVRDPPLAYEGTFRDGRRDGVGTAYHPPSQYVGGTGGDLVQYHGEWRDGTYHGRGREYALDGQTVVRSGRWDTGVWIRKRHSQPMPSPVEVEGMREGDAARRVRAKYALTVSPP